MGEITKVKTAGHEEWLKLRKRYIGGSDAAAIVGLNPWVSRYSLWAEKTGRIPGFAGNLATEVGTFLEEFVAQKFAEVTGKKVRRCNLSIFNSDYPFAIANIDREIVGEDAGLEIKTTDSLNLKKFKNGEFPATYYCQCMWYLAVTGKKRWYLAVLIGNKEFKRFTIERDEAEIEALMTAGADFYELMKNDTPPAVDGMEATTEAIKTIYSDSNDSSCDLYGYSYDISRYMELGKQIAELEAQRDEHANRIKQFMGESSMGKCDRYKVLWKPQSKRSFDSKKYIKENPGIDLSGFYKTSTIRVFRVTEVKE